MGGGIDYGFVRALGEALEGEQEGVGGLGERLRLAAGEGREGEGGKSVEIGIGRRIFGRRCWSW